MIRIIAAVSKNNVMGKDGKLPFHYPEDLKHFKDCTLNCPVIMGRKTYESIGKPLPNRKNIVVTSGTIKEVSTAKNFKDALDQSLGLNKDIWIIGGESIYREGMLHAEEIYLTITPDYIEGDHLILFPEIDSKIFKIKETKKLSNLDLIIYTRKA